MSKQSYGPPPDPNPEQSYPPPPPPPLPPPPLPRPWWHYLVALLLFVVGIWLGTTLEGCSRTTELEVTRIVEVTTTPGSAVAPEPGATVEVTRVVTQIVPVTTVITETVEVTPAEPVTTVITKTVETTREVEVTRIVPVTTVVTNTVETIRVVTRVVELPPPSPEYDGQGCTRFNLEVGRNRFDGTPVDGTYYIVERPFDRYVNVIASWAARQGYLDSGWIENIPLSTESVHVQVWFYPAPYGLPILLEIVNPAPGTPYGWLTRNVCHALELQFPE